MAVTLTRDDMMAFAQRWIDAWNRRDVAAVLAHFADDARFVSPKAAAFVGTSVLEGKAALAAYWHTGLATLYRIEFVFDHALWDPAARTLVVVYQATLNDTTTRSCEIMRFDADGQQIAGEALYGAAL